MKILFNIILFFFAFVVSINAMHNDKKSEESHVFIYCNQDAPKKRKKRTDFRAPQEYDKYTFKLNLRNNEVTWFGEKKGPIKKANFTDDRLQLNEYENKDKKKVNNIVLDGQKKNETVQSTNESYGTLDINEFFINDSDDRGINKNEKLIAYDSINSKENASKTCNAKDILRGYIYERLASIEHDRLYLIDLCNKIESYNDAQLVNISKMLGISPSGF